MSSIEPINRFMSKVINPIGVGCWLWTASKTTGGYGQFNGGAAHRFSYEYFIGRIPEGLHIDHLCRARGCVNPQHLELVTHKENVQRGVIARLGVLHPPKVKSKPKQRNGGNMVAIQKADLKLFFKSHREISETMGVSKQWVDVIQEVRNDEQAAAIRDEVKKRMKDIVEAYARIQEGGANPTHS